MIILVKDFGLVILIVLVMASCLSVKNGSQASAFTGVWIGSPYCKAKKMMISNEARFTCLQQDFQIIANEVPSAPLTVQEEFQNAFKGNYYSKFFEIIHIDSKLFRLFRDSVQILAIANKNSKQQNLFQCNTCNKIATLQFRNRTYHYPFFWPESSDASQQYDIILDTFVGYQRKIWIAKTDSLTSGVTYRGHAHNTISVITEKSTARDTIRKTLLQIIPLL